MEYLIISLIILIFILLHIIFLIGFFKSNSLTPEINKCKNKVTVIVAARNEETIISRCINSLKNLNYDNTLLEIILVNDKSTDRTKEIMLSKTVNNKIFTVIDSRNDEINNLKGKANAIDTAIQISKGDIIMLTDADCIVQPGWVMQTEGYFDKKTQMVCGFTKINYENSFFAKLQALDWIYLQSLASCSSGINNILSCIGNNISFTKEVYLEIGGYRNIKFSITEDLALMRKIDSTGKNKIKYPINYDCLVNTDECKSIGELYSQKKRWFKGGFGIGNLGWFFGFELFSINLLFLTGFLWVDIKLYYLIVLTKFITEFIIIFPVYVKLRFESLIKYFPLFCIYFSIYGICLPFTFLSGKKVEWKNRKL